MLRIARYGNSRFWALYDGPDLVVVTVYKRGARAVQRRLAAQPRATAAAAAAAAAGPGAGRTGARPRTAGPGRRPGGAGPRPAEQRGRSGGRLTPPAQLAFRSYSRSGGGEETLRGLAPERTRQLLSDTFVHNELMRRCCMHYPVACCGVVHCSALQAALLASASSPPRVSRHSLAVPPRSRAGAAGGQRRRGRWHRPCACPSM